MFLSITFLSLVFAQTQTGSIRGIIKDDEGNTLSGVTITVSSEALMGIRSYISTTTGAYRFPALPPGTYIIAAELSGFKKITRGDIAVRVGKVFTINLTMEMTSIDEEVTVVAPSPTIDVKQTKINAIVSKEEMEKTPIPRDIIDIVVSNPGVVDYGGRNPGWVGKNVIIHGEAGDAHQFSIDGVGLTDALNGHVSQTLNIDIIEEVELITAAKPAEVGYTPGGFINIVTRSGGNKFSGGASVLYTGDKFAQSLWPSEQSQSFGVEQPLSDKSLFDGSLSFGGPILKDKLWFFSNVRLTDRKQSSNFIAYTDVLGQHHEGKGWEEQHLQGFLKLTFQLASNMKLTGLLNYGNRNSPGGFNYGHGAIPSPYRTWASTPKTERIEQTLSSVLNLIISQNAYADIYLNYIGWDFLRDMQPEVKDSPSIRDFGSPYGWITSPIGQQYFRGKRWEGGASFNLFKDNFLGGSHEIKAGISAEYYKFTWDRFRGDNMIWYWRNGPYYYSDAEKLGFVRFVMDTLNSGGYEFPANEFRIGGYIQDSMTISNRLTLSFGIRIDQFRGSTPAFHKEDSANPLSVILGDTVVRTFVQNAYPETFPEGINPFEARDIPAWSNMSVWTNIDPRFGFVFDVFGNGKTALKGSYSRYTRYMDMECWIQPHSYSPGASNYIDFLWQDSNGNGNPDVGDSFTPYLQDFRVWDFDFVKDRISSDLSSPWNEEISMGIWQELFKQFSGGLTFTYWATKNFFERALYDPELGEFWFNPDSSAGQRYWIPFTTIVPGTDGYPDQEVTLYFRSKDAPGIFERLENIDELKRKYWSLEFAFKKPWSNGWQFSGSIVFSKSYGNIQGLNEGPAHGRTANYYVNAYGRLWQDKPLVIKLMGTVELPFNILLSGYYRHLSGEPWQRSVNIQPPKSWAEENDAYWTGGYYENVKIEPLGSRRKKDMDFLDLRIEKEFIIRDFGIIGAYLEVFNVLGWSNVEVDENDLFRYLPSAENSLEPENIILNPSYKLIRSVDGLRTLRFSLRFKF